MTDQQMTELFEGVDVTGAPPLPPGHTQQLVRAGRRSVRRRRMTTLLAGLTLVAVTLGVAGLVSPDGDRLTPADPSASTASLPDRIAPFSLLTAHVSADPAGRAIMIYQFGNGELFNVYQPLALGADGDTYRQIDGARADQGFRPWLLSPDGTFVVMAEAQRATAAFTVVSLATGKQRAVALPEPIGVTPLAISPNGRYVAYSTVAVPEDTRSLDAIEHEAAQLGMLAIMDLETGRSTSVPDFKPVQAAAFAPDSQRLAVQTKFETWVVTVDGRKERQVPMPQGYGIQPNVAWSPDGKLLAAVAWTSESWQLLDGTTATVYVRAFGSGKVEFVDATGAGGAVPNPLQMDEILGWRSGDRLVTVTNSDAPEIFEVPLNGGEPRVISRVDTGTSCELGMQRCNAYEISVATGLLQSATLRAAGEPDRGPWPTWFVLVVAGTTALVLLGCLLVVRAVRRRTRRARIG